MTDEEKLLRLMDRLIERLDGLRADPEMRQLWLETHWLRTDLQAGQMSLPTNWELTMFKPTPSVNNHPEIAALVKELADAVRQYVTQKLAPPDNTVWAPYMVASYSEQNWSSSR